MEREWKLGQDLIPSDSILDGVTFDDLILAVHCNCPVINRNAVVTQLNNIIEMRMEDTMELLSRNIDIIVEEAMKGRIV